MNKLGLYAICITIAEFFTIVALFFVFIRAGYASKLLIRLGLQETVQPVNWAATSWNNSLIKLDYDADIVFFGDSLIRGSDFRKNFPNRKIVNLGYTGDTLSGMLDRVPGVVALNPEQVFIMGGVNSLTEKTIAQCLRQYAQIIDEFQNKVPSAQIYIHSLLPISKERETSSLRNSTIVSFNQQLKEVSCNKGVTYIDVFSLYVQDDSMNLSLTKDGLHLYPEAYDRWAKLLENHIPN